MIGDCDYDWYVVVDLRTEGLDLNRHEDNPELDAKIAELQREFREKGILFQEDK